MTGGAQAIAQGRVVVDLPVLDDVDRAVLVRDRLIAALEVDDRQAARPDPRDAVDVLAPAVGPAVAQGRGHRRDQLTPRRLPSVEGDEATDSAHRASLPNGGPEPPSLAAERPPQDPRRGGAEDAQIKRHRPVGDVLEVV